MRNIFYIGTQLNRNIKNASVTIQTYKDWTFFNIGFNMC